MVSSGLNEACAVFRRSDSPCILMTLTERLLPDGGRQEPLERHPDKDPPPPPAFLLIRAIFINNRETKQIHLLLEPRLMELLLSCSVIKDRRRRLCYRAASGRRVRNQDVLQLGPVSLGPQRVQT